MSKNKTSIKLAKPTYLQDKRDIKARNHELYKPVKDQARVYEMHQIEKRYKMNFEQKKKDTTLHSI